MLCSTSVKEETSSVHVKEKIVKRFLKDLKSKLLSKLQLHIGVQCHLQINADSVIFNLLCLG